MIDISGIAAGFGALSGELVEGYSFYLDNGSALAEIRLELDELAVYGDLDSSVFLNRFDIASQEDIVIEAGIEKEYADGDYGYFMPSKTTICFAVLGDDTLAMQYFRDAVLSVRIIVDAQDYFNGKIDRKSVRYSFAEKLLYADFAPFLRPDRSFKTNEGIVDPELFQLIFRDVVGGDTGTAAADWLRLNYVITQLLTFFGATSVRFGNFNRLFSCVVLANTGLALGSYATSGAYGFDGSTSFDTWLASAAPNIVFDRLLIYKPILCQTGSYSGVGANSLVDVLSNLCREIGAVMGIAPTGEGFVIPSYGGTDVAAVDEQDIISVDFSGYLDRSNSLVACGSVYPQTSYTVQPGMAFVPGVTTFGTVRYDIAGTHYTSYYSEFSLWQDTLQEETAPVKIVRFMHNPIMGRIPAGVGVEGFGYSPSTGISHNGSDLKCVKYIGTEEQWYTTGTTWYLNNDCSAIVSQAAWYFSLFRTDREQVTLEVAGIDYQIYQAYRLPDAYGDGLSFRPSSMRINLSQGRTTITGIALTENTLIKPDSSGGSGGTGYLTLVAITGVLSKAAGVEYWSTFWVVVGDYLGFGNSGTTARYDEFGITYAGYATYEFLITSPGLYRVFIKIRSAADTEFAYAFDTDTAARFFTYNRRVIEWVQLPDKTLGTGSHTLKLYCLEPYVRIYTIYLTKNGDTPT
ncbi:MAG: hypothetical protein WCK32_00745 [Chlorobiaceae bacterium]